MNWRWARRKLAGSQTHRRTRRGQSGEERRSTSSRRVGSQMLPRTTLPASYRTRAHSRPFLTARIGGKSGRDAHGSPASVVHVPEGLALQRLSWPPALDVRERYAPLAMTTCTRELTAPSFGSPTVEQLGYMESLLHLPDKSLPEGPYETAAIARRVGDTILNIDRFLHGACDSAGLAHRILGHAVAIQGYLEDGWHRLAKRTATAESALPAYRGGFRKLIGGYCCR
jgi:hypothetical protein